MSFNPRFEAKNDLQILEQKKKQLEAQGKALNQEDLKKYNELKSLFPDTPGNEPNKDTSKRGGPNTHV